jgi:nickel transport system substrate-binding protein
LSGTRFPASVRDVETAKKLLDEAGWVGEGIRQKDGKPLEIELVVSEEQLAGSRSLAEIMQAQLGEVGIGIKIRSVDHASRHSDIPARNYDMALFFTLGAPYEPYGSIIGMLLSTYDNGVDGKLVVDPKNLDPLVEAVMTASAADAPAKTQAVYDWMHNETAFLPLFYNPTIWGHSERVKGFKAPATEYDMPYDGVTIEG